MKSAVRIILVFILLSVLFVTGLLLTESGMNWVYQQAIAYLPEGLRIEKIEGRLIGPMTFTGVDYQQADTHIKARQLIVDWHPSALFTANIEVQLLHIQSLHITLPPTADASPENLQLPDVYLPWRMSLEDVQIDDVTIQQDEQTIHLQHIRLNASTLFSHIHIKQLSVRAENVMVDVKGELQPTANYPHNLDIGWQFTGPDSAVIQGHGQLVGNLQQTQLKQQLTGPLQLSLNAELNDLAGHFNWQAAVDVSAFDTAKLLPDWPAVTGQLKLQGKGDLATAEVSGKANGYYAETGTFNVSFQTRLHDKGAQIEQLTLQIPGNKTQLMANGQWLFSDPGGDIKAHDIKLVLNWKNLRWPMQGTPWFDSASGHGNIEGTLDHYRIVLATESPWPQAAPSHWNARAEGNADGLRFQELRIKALDGEAVVTGQLKWSPALSWKADAQLTDINPASRWPDWPGKLSAKLQSSGRMQNDHIMADVDIRQLNGLLRGYPVSLRSRMSWRDEGMDIPLFDFHSGTSHVSAQGRVGENLSLDWRVESDNLSELYPQVQGTLQAAGQLEGRQDAPVIKATFDGQDLGLPGYRIGHIDGTVAVDLLQWQHMDIRLAAQALTLNGYALQTVDITADSKQLRAQVTSDIANVNIELKGERDAKGWQGQIVRADIQSSQFDDWQLKAPTVLMISENALQLESLCWHNNQQSSLCGSVQRDRELWQSTIQIAQLPLLLFSRWLPPDLKLEGTVDATAELQMHEPDQLLGAVHITLPPGAVNYALVAGDRNRWTYRGGGLDLFLTAQGVKASSELAMNNGDQLRLDVSLPGAQLLTLNPPHQNVHANAQLTVQDLGLVETLVPEIQDVKGAVTVALSVDGTLARPRFSGKAELHEGAFRIPRFGLSIDQLNLQGQSDGDETIRYTLGARSGEGSLAIHGQTLVDSAAGWLTELGIKGENFEVSRIPEARVQVSPDLQVKIQHHNINISGNVDIPFARLQPKDVTTAVRVSDDAVMVGGEQQPEPKWLIASKVRLTLGDKVNFFGFGFEGQLGGSLLLEEEPGQLTKASGEINVLEGRYRAYGQRLEIERGRLVFAGGPLTNPGLDLRAVRHVNAITAGVKVKGSLVEPQLELFSTPAMGQTDMLSYLILGRPMETATGEEGAMIANAALAVSLGGGDKLARALGDRFGLDEMRVESSEQGDQASFVVGRFLTPKIYVSYGVGLIEAINTFTVRYQISDQWNIKAESGEAQGADIFYTIDR